MDKDKELKDFEKACDNLATCKYILVDKRISELLEIISKSKTISSYIIESSINFDFTRELQKCDKNGKLTLPERDYMLVAFVYAMLQRFDEKKLNITEFLAKYFSDNLEGVDSYKYFNMAVLERFKATILNHFIKKTKPNNAGDLAVTTKKYTPEIIKRAVFLIEEIEKRSLKNKLYTEHESRQLFSALKSAFIQNAIDVSEAIVMVLRKAKFKEKGTLIFIEDLIKIVGV